jgi:hypothetical protein
MSHHTPSEDCKRTLQSKEIFRKDANFDKIDGELLTIARLYFQAFAIPSCHSWIGALDWAETKFGDADGPVIGARLLTALQEMRRARRSVFHFNSPVCVDCSAIVTEHERRLMAVLQAIRRHHMGAAKTEMMMLCEGNDSDDALVALERLVSSLPKNAPTADLRTHV